jgi:hypothetical protein
VGSWPDTIVTSSDGETWSHHSLGAPNFLSAVTWANGLFVSVGLKTPPEQSAAVMTSPDGIHLTDQPALPGVALNDVAYGNGTFVAVGSAVATSPDGVQWMPRTFEAPGISGPLRRRSAH